MNPAEKVLSEMRSLAFALIVSGLTVVAAPRAGSAQVTENIVSDHVRIRVAAERAWLARETVVELERSWQFVNRATGGRLPKRVFVDIDWDGLESSNDPEASAIRVGMSHPAAARDRRGFLVHHAARQMAEMGLLDLSKGGAGRPGLRFLLDGMSEILSHEYSQTTRALTGAWAMCHLLDRMQPISLDRPAAAAAAPGDVHSLQTAAAGITFLVVAREQEGRDRLLKFFEELKKGSLEEAVRSAFKVSAAALEETWLGRIRSYSLADATATAEEDAPVLRSVLVSPEPAPAGSPVQVRISIDDRAGDIVPGGVFLHEANPGIVHRARLLKAGPPVELAVDVPPLPGAGPGRRDFRITAIDEAGNVRNWTGSYTTR